MAQIENKYIIDNFTEMLHIYLNRVKFIHFC